MKLRWGLLGCGYICNDFTLAMKNSKKDQKIVAVGASSLSRAQEFIIRLNLTATAHNCYNAVLSDPSVDIVYIGLINVFHKEWAIKALKAGKHVLCEKPLGLNAKEVREMIDVAREEKKFLMAGYWTVFFDSYKYIQNVIVDKSLGEVRLVKATFGYLLLSSDINISLGETMLTALGCYTLMVAYHIYGKSPKSISYWGEKNELGSDSWTNLHLNFGPNEDAILFFDERHFLPSEAVVAFENGSIQVHHPFWCPTSISIRKDAKSAEVIDFPLNDNSNEYNFPNSAGLQFEQDHVYDCIVNGKIESDILTLDKTLALQEIIDEVREKMGIVFPQD